MLLDTHTLIEGARCYGVSLSDIMIDKLHQYATLVEEFSQRMNLVSKRDLERFTEYHILDSLKLHSIFTFSEISTALDFGSGAGLPGIPLAIVNPHISFTLVDSRLKRCQFLSEIVPLLSLQNVDIQRTRVEEWMNPACYDVVVTRATVTLVDYYTMCHRFLCTSGSLLAIKGETISDEIESCQNTMDLSCFNISTKVPPVFGSVRQGTLVRIQKQ